MGEPKLEEAPKPKISVAPPPQAAGNGLGRLKYVVGFLFLVMAVMVFKPLQELVGDALFYEKTDDAQVAGRVIFLAAKVGGPIAKVNFDDNALVKKGDVLVQIDPRESENRVRQVQSEVNIAQIRFNTASRNLEEAKKPANSALVAAAQAAYDEALAGYWAAKAKLDQAKLDLEWTVVRAPSDGRVGKREVEVGTVLRPFQSITSFVNANERWVVANFKETQLNNVQVGKEVELVVDSVEGKTFSGKVESISPASGSTFALIPPDNATGNFTKIVQRVAVKIAFDPKSTPGFEDRLIPGSSVVARVKRTQ